MPSSRLSNSSSGIIVSASGAIGAQRRRRELDDHLLRDRCDAHGPHHLVAVSEIGERLDVGASHEHFVGRRPAAQPFGVELAHVTLGQRTVFAQARALRLRKLGREHQQRAEDHRQHEDDHDGDLGLEVEQPRAEVEDAVGEQSGEHRAVRDREQRERVGRVGQESQAAEAVRVGGDQAQLDA